tara:strand:- start:3392 stop:3916 length:525 start_codon:yes stop_codon:yes gene_type:complete
MNINDLIKNNIERLHRDIEEAIEGLTSEEIHWVPSDSFNHIAFNLWHYVRTEDNLIRFVIQERRPTIWIEQDWYSKFELDRISQGTGMPTDEANAIRINYLDQFCEYMTEVWKSTSEYLSGASEADLAKEFIIRSFGEISAAQIITEILLTHGFTHVGEILMLKKLQGISFQSP